MTIRDYDPERDLKAAQRIWRECGCIDDVSGDPALLKSLDETIRLPKPHPGWDF